MGAFKALFLLLLLFSTQVLGGDVEVADTPIKVRVVAATAEGNHLFHEADAYRIALLKLAISKSQKPIVLVYAQGSLLVQGQGTFIGMVERGRLDVAWSMTSKEREGIALPVRVPIYRGLMGWRIGLIRAEERERFLKLKHPERLKTVVLGQGHDWPDTEILRHNGFVVETGLTFHARFKMLSAGRYDYFPRSVVEVWDELNHITDKSIELDTSFAIHYPTAFYYFVNKKRRVLAELIQQGLLRAIEDGSFNALFMRYYGEAIERSKLNQRKVLYLDNPLLPEKTPIDDERLWYHPKLDLKL